MRLVLSDRALTCVPVGRDFEYVDLSALKIAPCVGVLRLLDPHPRKVCHT